MPRLAGAIVSRSSSPALPYPGRIIKRKEKDESIVRAVQRRLNESGVGPVDEDGDYGKDTEGAVRLFQARFTDADGQPLKVDGQIGSITWAVLFGTATVPTIAEPTTTNPMIGKVLEIASSLVGVMEKPAGSNRGPQVDKFIKSVGLNPTGRYAWCAAFIYYCFNEAAKELGLSNPVVRTAGVLDHWSKAGVRKVPRIMSAKAWGDPHLVRPGQIFIMDYGGGHGHTGLVERVVGGKLVTIEGNTNDGGSREGIGVFRREQRKIASINKGFIDYSSLCG